ncbi:hypothetical protein D3C79_775560 [compost metagenome]
MQPHRILVDVIREHIDRLPQQLDDMVGHRLRHRHKGPGLEHIVSGVAFAFPVPALECQRVAFPHIPGVPTTQLFIPLPPGILVPHRAGLRSVAVLGA